MNIIFLHSILNQVKHFSGTFMIIIKKSFENSIGIQYLFLSFPTDASLK